MLSLTLRSKSLVWKLAEQGWLWTSKGRGLLDPLKVWNFEFEGSISILRCPIEKFISSLGHDLIHELKWLNRIFCFSLKSMLNITLLASFRILQHIYLLQFGCYDVLLGFCDALLQHTRNIVNDFVLNISHSQKILDTYKWA